MDTKLLAVLSILSIAIFSLGLGGCAAPYYIVPKGYVAQEQPVPVVVDVPAPVVVYVAPVPVYYGPGCYSRYCGVPFGFGFGLNLNLHFGGHKHHGHRR